LIQSESGEAERERCVIKKNVKLPEALEGSKIKSESDASLRKM